MSAEFTCTTVSTPRLATNVWSSGPDDGVPILLVHGNLSTGGYWRYVADALGELADDVRVIAPDLRGFGRTEALPIDATRGLGDMVEDVHALLDALGLADECRVIAAGWSMGAGVLEQLMVGTPRTSRASSSWLPCRRTGSAEPSTPQARPRRRRREHRRWRRQRRLRAAPRRQGRRRAGPAEQPPRRHADLLRPGRERRERRRGLPRRRSCS